MTQSASNSHAHAASHQAPIDRDLFCPLCDYNLRGLTEARCPECGHQFEWADLLDQHRWHLNWLFEHNRDHKIRAFLQTLRHSMQPAQFWNTVRPSHRPRVGRLILYWLVLTLPVLLAAGVVLSLPALHECRKVYYARQASEANLGKLPDNHPGKLRLIATHGSLRAAAAAMAPMPGPAKLVELIRTGPLSVILGFAACCAAWPAIVALSFIVFRDTLRQARIKSTHILRCAIYSADVGILLAAGLVPLLFWRAGTYDKIIDHWAFSYPVFDPHLFLFFVVWFVLLTYRLTTAYRRYLGFRHALLVGLWSQAIFLVLLCAAMSIE